MSAKDSAPKNGPESAPEVALKGFILPTPFDPNKDNWADLVEGADRAQGTDLLKDELFDTLVNVPFLIYRVSFYPGTPRPNGLGDGSFCAAELLIGDEKALKRRRIDLDSVPFLPGDTVVVNDGSTGMSRQIVSYLCSKGYISLPDDLPETGPAGTTRYDLPVEEWQINVGEPVPNKEDPGRYQYTADVRIHCPRGIRLSEYTPEGLKNTAKTRYIA